MISNNLYYLVICQYLILFITINYDDIKFYPISTISSVIPTNNFTSISFFSSFLVVSNLSFISNN